MIIPPRKANPRLDYRLQQNQRANSSPNLAKKYPNLKSLKVYLEYFDSDGLRKCGELTCKVNVRHAKSVFSVDCRNHECVGGDFDLSGVLEDAIREKRKVAEGQIACRGRRTNPKEDKGFCHNLLRYKLSLAYAA
ncbi:MAG: hypothetical protein FJ403_22820 [Verrucomicrobia bacterium]|nr:hypothetical protein [Verrucomicrobiota bacterium]